MALNMVASNSSNNSPRVQGPSGSAHGNAPSSYRSPPVTSPFDTPVMQPSRSAPHPPGSSSRRGSSNHGHGTPFSSNHNSPNPNRYSTGAVPPSVAMGIASSNGGPTRPPRPVRAGTLPLNEHPAAANGVPTPLMSAKDVSVPLPSAAWNHSGMTPTTATGLVPTPPPLTHQPFSAPGNPYAGAELGKTFDEKMSLGGGVAMAVGEPRDKDLPKEPVTMGRNRSGTGKSSRDKKSVFGVLTGELSDSTFSDPRLTPCRTSNHRQKGSCHFNALRPHTSHPRRFRL